MIESPRRHGHYDPRYPASVFAHGQYRIAHERLST